jgi:alpha-L-fucosidase 2
MEIKLIKLFILLSAIITTSSDAQPDNNLKIWYDKTASGWEEALPIGNGRLGALILGDPVNDHILFNEETLLTGETHSYSQSEAYGYLVKIKEPLMQNKQQEAHTLALNNFMSIPLIKRKYQPFGDLWISFSGHENVSGYRRELDIANAICRTSYTVSDTSIFTEYFASFRDNVIGIMLSSDKKKALTFDLSLSALHEEASIIATEDGILELNIKVKDEFLNGTAILKIFITGGKMTLQNNGFHIEQTTKAEIWLTIAMSDRNFTAASETPEERCFTYLKTLEVKGYAKVRKEHIADYRKYLSSFSDNSGI